MKLAHFSTLLATIAPLLQVIHCYDVVLSSDGPTVLGGIITFRADLYDSEGNRPSGNFYYAWKDDALIPHEYQTNATQNTTVYYSVSYPEGNYSIGTYEMEVKVYKEVWSVFWSVIQSRRIEFQVTSLLNGNLTVMQLNQTLENEYVSSTAETHLMINMRKGDKKFALSSSHIVTSYWFIDCKYYGQAKDLSFSYNFTTPNVSHTIEALVVVSKKPPSYPPTSTTTTTTVAPPSNTSTNSNIRTTDASKTAPYTTMTVTSSTTTNPPVNATMMEKLLASVIDATDTTGIGNSSIRETCLNSSIITPDPEKTYGYFETKLISKVPISNISVEGTNWIQPWDMLNLSVTCKGSGPFTKCLQFHRGKYNITGNETCEYNEKLSTCNFNIIRYFLEPSVYTILVILENDIGPVIYPLTINIYKVTKKAQLSVIVVPVSCSLAAVVLIVFGVAYYIQNRARFTVEVADFDFGKSNPDMEYKTFMERLRDSFNNPGTDKIRGYTPLSNPDIVQ